MTEVLWLGDGADLDNHRVLSHELKGYAHPRKVGPRLYFLCMLPDEGEYWLGPDGRELFRLRPPLAALAPQIEAPPPWHKAVLQIESSVSLDQLPVPFRPRLTRPTA
jgi:hypothetical protein